MAAMTRLRACTAPTMRDAAGIGQVVVGGRKPWARGPAGTWVSDAHHPQRFRKDLVRLARRVDVNELVARHQMLGAGVGLG